MKKYTDKVFEGISPTVEDWNAQLKWSHEKAPNMSPQVFAGCRNSLGLNSYEWLVQGLRSTANRPTVLDLACGEGFLIPIIQQRFSDQIHVVGVDMSEVELKQARRRDLGDSVEFVHASVQDLTLEPETFDIVSCHMALMLMLPLDPVLAQIRHVLKPGGEFVAVVNDKDGSRGVFSEVQKALAEFLKEEFPKMAKPLTGDDRIQTREGLQVLFSEFGAPLQIDEEQFACGVDFQGLWKRLENMYLIAMLPDHKKLLFKERLRKRVGEADHKLELPMRRLRIQKEGC